MPNGYGFGSFYGYRLFSPLRAMKVGREGCGSYLAIQILDTQTH